MSGVLFRVTRWCVRGAWRICAEAVRVVDVCGFAVGVGATISVVVPNIVAIFCKVVPWCPWKVWFYFRVFWMDRINFVDILFASSIGGSTGML